MSEQQTNLRNEDFRKLLTSTRSSRPAESTFHAPEAPAAKSGGASFRHKHKPPPKKDKKASGNDKARKAREKEQEEEDEAHLKNILKNYRDRADERRKQGDQPEDVSKLTAAYRAVPSDVRTARTQAESRKQAILESKYLGGDIEHTHLVKGLDYSLLNKVRSEMTKGDEDEEDEFEDAFEEGGQKAAAQLAQELATSQSENRMVRSLHKVLFKNDAPVKNDLFAKGRMAYVVEVEDEESDIPTTLLRSLHDIPRAESAQSIQANNLIISKLTQVLTYIRADSSKKKKREVEKPERRYEEVKERSKPKGDSIYDDLDEYVPSRRHRSRSRSRERDDRRDRDRHRDRDRRSGAAEYFEKPKRDDRRDKERERERQKEKERLEAAKKEKDDKEKEKRLEEKMEKRRKETESAGYDECYPGGMDTLGGQWDSDEETDFSKMDNGSKKNGVNRWDFDNEEEYAKYMENREAMPKAAYQYGQKVSDGRKSKKNIGNDAKKLDRELNEINKIMEKRKAGGDEEKNAKKIKY